MTQIWKPIAGFEGFYEVSNFGSVQSLDRTITVHRGSKTYTASRRGKMLSPIPNPRGALTVYLHKNGTLVRRWVHHLVLEAFIGPNPGSLDGCHDNGNPGDNRPENLRWDTRSANHRDKRRHGTDHNLVKDQCKWGHPYDEENTYYYPHGGRDCRECRRKWSRKWQRQNYVPVLLRTA